jgi:hypothetical protein
MRGTCGEKQRTPHEDLAGVQMDRAIKANSRLRITMQSVVPGTCPPDAFVQKLETGEMESANWWTALQPCERSFITEARQ